MSIEFNRLKKTEIGTSFHELGSFTKYINAESEKVQNFTPLQSPGNRIHDNNKIIFTGPPVIFEYYLWVKKLGRQLGNLDLVYP